MKEESELVRVGFDIPRSVHQKLKIYAIHKGTTLRNVLVDMISREIGESRTPQSADVPRHEWRQA